MSIVFSSDERQEFRPGKLEAFEAIMALAIGHAFGCYNPKQWADYLGLTPQKIYAQMLPMEFISTTRSAPQNDGISSLRTD